MQLIFTWITAFLLLIAGLSGAKPSEDGEARNESAVSVFAEMADQAGREGASEPAEMPEKSAVRAGVSYGDIAYERYDPKWFCDDAERLSALADEGKADEAIELYDSLRDRFEYADTLYVLAMLRHDADIYDAYWAEEYSCAETLWMEMSDAFCTACADALASPVSDEFAAYIGYEAAEVYAAYETMTDEQMEAGDRELELEEEYLALYDNMGDISCTYLGEAWTLDAFNGFRGEALWRRDYDGYVTVYYGLQQALCEAFAPVFIELVELRAQQARDAGYDSYADYAYELLFGRDYTPAEAQMFCDAVKPAAAEYYAKLYYSDVFTDASYTTADMDTAALFDAVGAHIAQLDEALSEPWRFMTEGGFYDISTYDGGRYSGSYTTELTYYDAPFIFLSGEGGFYDLITLTHEFGHFADMYFHPLEDVIISVPSLDLEEVHSNGLQALFTAYYSDIFGRDADAAAFVNVAFLMENVLDGCMYDEFMRRVFDEADALTAERVNEIYLDVCLDYGVYDRDDLPTYDASWVYIGHLFKSPLYYISYAASGIAALQLWDMAQADFDAAVGAYMSVLKAGACDDTYFEVLEASGLRAFTEEGAAAEILADVQTRLEEMERAAAENGFF